MRVRALAVVAILGWTAPPSIAQAQGFDAGLVKPGLAGRTLIVTSGSETLAPYALRGAVLTDLGINTLRADFGRRVGVVVGRDMLAHGTLRVGMPYATELALSAPLRVHALGKNPELAPPDNGLDPALGDLRLAVRHRVHEDVWGGVFVAPFVVLPTGSQEELMGGGAVSGGLISGIDGGEPTGALHWAANVMWWERSSEDGVGTPRGRQFRASAGADYGLIRRYQLAVRAGLEILSVVSVPPAGGGKDTPLEVFASASADVGRCALRFGVGRGLVGGIGASSMRMLFGVGCGAQPSRDRDGDSLNDLEDKCPDEPEDRDGFEDSDGCPEADNDQDGVLDGADKCPSEPQAEGREDGCPVPDGDGDGIEGAADKCPDQPEDKDGYEDTDGCPDTDDDSDGVADKDDACKEAKEDKDGFEDADGCPDPDNDSDGFADGDDKCPDEGETWNGDADDDGCPDGEALVVVTGGEIQFTPALPFKKGKAKLKKKKAALAFKALASLLSVRPDIARITITGVVDVKGKEKKSVKVGAKRAAVVVGALEALGVAAERMTAEGAMGDDGVTIRFAQP